MPDCGGARARAAGRFLSLTTLPSVPGMSGAHDALERRGQSAASTAFTSSATMALGMAGDSHAAFACTCPAQGTKSGLRGGRAETGSGSGDGGGGSGDGGAVATTAVTSATTAVTAASAAPPPTPPQRLPCRRVRRRAAPTVLRMRLQGCIRVQLHRQGRSHEPEDTVGPQEIKGAHHEDSMTGVQHVGVHANPSAHARLNTLTRKKKRQ